MFSTGIVRKLDSLGRITLPKELRNTHNIKIRDSMEFFTDEDKIIIKKYDPTDVFTGEIENEMVEYHGKKIAKKTVRELIWKAGFTIEE